MKRYVTRTRKDSDGDILALCNPGSAWSPRLKQGAIADIKGRIHTYVVLWSDRKETTIRVIPGSTGEYLRTVRDNTSRNNLDDLPDC